ncbi:hypothetical protein TNCV_1953351 [Trichonephila clavipes]|nr:hypothetical protein TNCV_1953351 [Trichonephila clavipes]
MTPDGLPPSTAGTANGLLAMCIRDDDLQHFLSRNCIIHQQALYCKLRKMRNVMEICMKVVNSVRGRMKKLLLEVKVFESQKVKRTLNLEITFG